MGKQILYYWAAREILQFNISTGSCLNTDVKRRVIIKDMNASTNLNMKDSLLRENADFVLHTF